MSNERSQVHPSAELPHAEWLHALERAEHHFAEGDATTARMLARQVELAADREVARHPLGSTPRRAAMAIAARARDVWARFARVKKSG